MILLVSFSLAAKGLLSLLSFLHSFLDEYFENSQFSIPTLISKFYIISPTSTFCLKINKDDHGGTVF